MSNAATDRPVFGDRFNTGNEEAALLARGFQYGTAPGALVVGWNGRHTAVSLPDGTAVSSGEGGGVRIGGAGAFQPQFTHHMFLPVDPQALGGAPPPADGPVLVGAAAPEMPEPAPAPPQAEPAPAEPVDAILPAPEPVPAAPVGAEPPAPDPAPAGNEPDAGI